MGCRFYHYYPVPEDLMSEVVKVLPEDDWTILSATVVAVADPAAAIYLRACFPERPLGRAGAEVLDPHEVWVEQAEREEAERLLREACPSAAAWFQVLQVAFESAAEHRAFTQVYTDLTGIPHGSAAVATQAGSTPWPWSRPSDPGSKVPLDRRLGAPCGSTL